MEKSVIGGNHVGDADVEEKFVAGIAEVAVHGEHAGHVQHLSMVRMVMARLLRDLGTLKNY